MATITSIAGTDSLSSSRLIINDNFSNVNSQVANLATLLDFDNQSLNLSGTVLAGTLKINNKFTVTSTVITNMIPVSNSAHVTYATTYSGSTSSGAAFPAANGIVKGTYIITGAGQSITMANSGYESGQDVTFISTDAGGATVNASNVAGGAITIAQNVPVTLRFITNTWYKV